MDDKLYKIGVYKSRFNWPKRCVCCFGKPDAQLKIPCSLKLDNLVDLDKSPDLYVPYCKQCLKHIENQKPGNRLMLIGVVITILLLLAHAWIAAIVVFFVFLGLSLRMSMKISNNGTDSNDECSTLNEAVMYYGFKSGRHVFNFHNEQYAKSFHKLNSDDPDITYEETGMMSEYHYR